MSTPTLSAAASAPTLPLRVQVARRTQQSQSDVAAVAGADRRGEARPAAAQNARPQSLLRARSFDFGAAAAPSRPGEATAALAVRASALRAAMARARAARGAARRVTRQPASAEQMEAVAEEAEEGREAEDGDEAPKQPLQASETVRSDLDTLLRAVQRREHHRSRHHPARRRPASAATVAPLLLPPPPPPPPPAALVASMPRPRSAAQLRRVEEVAEAAERGREAFRPAGPRFRSAATRIEVELEETLRALPAGADAERLLAHSRALEAASAAPGNAWAPLLTRVKREYDGALLRTGAFGTCSGREAETQGGGGADAARLARFEAELAEALTERDALRRENAGLREEAAARQHDLARLQGRLSALELLSWERLPDEAGSAPPSRDAQRADDRSPPEAGEAAQRLPQPEASASAHDDEALRELRHRVATLQTELDQARTRELAALAALRDLRLSARRTELLPAGDGSGGQSQSLPEGAPGEDGDADGQDEVGSQLFSDGNEEEEEQRGGKEHTGQVPSLALAPLAEAVKVFSAAASEVEAGEDPQRPFTPLSVVMRGLRGGAWSLSPSDSSATSASAPDVGSPDRSEAPVLLPGQVVSPPR
jgi:hypothetical protein